MERTFPVFEYISSDDMSESLWLKRFVYSMLAGPRGPGAFLLLDLGSKLESSVRASMASGEGFELQVQSLLKPALTRRIKSFYVSKRSKDLGLVQKRLVSRIRISPGLPVHTREFIPVLGVLVLSVLLVLG